jgi:hypothetical protein
VWNVFDVLGVLFVQWTCECRVDIFWGIVEGGGGGETQFRFTADRQPPPIEV